MLQGLGGVLASIASIITIWLGSGPVQTGFSYFLIALLVTLGSLVIFFVLIRLVSCLFTVCISHCIVEHDGDDDDDDDDDENCSTSQCRHNFTAQNLSCLASADD